MAELFVQFNRRTEETGVHNYGIDIIWASRYDYGHGRGLSTHAHGFGQLIYFLDGAGELTYGGVSYPIVPGSLLLVPPMLSHGFVPLGRSKVRTLDVKFHLHEEGLASSIQACGGYYANDMEDVKTLLNNMLAEGIGKKRHYGCIARLCLLHALYLIARRAGEPFPEHPAHEADRPYSGEPAHAAVQVQRYVRQHCAEELTLDAIARQVRYSKAHIGRLISRHYGCSFAQFVRGQRIEQAKAYIYESDLTLKQIAESVGFKTIYHFTRVFKQVEGVSPGRWKARETAGVGKDIHFD